MGSRELNHEEEAMHIFLLRIVPKRNFEFNHAFSDLVNLDYRNQKVAFSFFFSFQFVIDPMTYSIDIKQ